VASPGYYHLFSGGLRVNADTEYGPWPEWNKRVYYDCFNVTDLYLNASTNGETAVVFGLRIGPGTYGHGTLAGHWAGPNFAKGYNASALPLLFELHVETKKTPEHGAGEGSGSDSKNEKGATTTRQVFTSGLADGSEAIALAFEAHNDPIQVQL